jgi:hypothetical protein
VVGAIQSSIHILESASVVAGVADTTASRLFLTNPSQILIDRDWPGSEAGIFSAAFTQKAEEFAAYNIRIGDWPPMGLFNKTIVVLRFFHFTLLPLERPFLGASLLLWLLST